MFYHCAAGPHSVLLLLFAIFALPVQIAAFELSIFVKWVKCSTTALLDYSLSSSFFFPFTLSLRKWQVLTFDLSKMCSTTVLLDHNLSSSYFLPVLLYPSPSSRFWVHDFSSQVFYHCAIKPQPILLLFVIWYLQLQVAAFELSILVKWVKCSTTVLLDYSLSLSFFSHFLSPSASGRFWALDLSKMCSTTVLLDHNLSSSFFLSFPLSQCKRQVLNSQS